MIVFPDLLAHSIKAKPQRRHHFMPRILFAQSHHRTAFEQSLYIRNGSELLLTHTSFFICPLTILTAPVKTPETLLLSYQYSVSARRILHEAFYFNKLKHPVQHNYLNKIDKTVDKPWTKKKAWNFQAFFTSYINEFLLMRTHSGCRTPSGARWRSCSLILKLKVSGKLEGSKQYSSSQV